MAVVKKTGAKKPKGAGVSLRFADASMGGLPDDFKGTITGSDFRPWNYEGKRDDYTLAHIVEITPFPGQDVGEDAVRAVYSVGSLEFFAPSQDGENPVDLEGDEDDMIGTHLVPVGDKQKLSKSSNFMTFIKSVEDALGEDAEKYVNEDISSLIGLSGHFNRVPQKKRSGLLNTETEGDEQRERTILLLTEVVAPPKGAATASKKKKVEEEVEEEEVEETDEEETEDEGDDMESQVAAAIVKVLKKQKGNKIGKAKLPPLVAAQFTAKSEKAEVLKLLNNKKFVGNIDGVEYDADDAVFSLA